MDHVRILIVEDHELVRTAIARLLNDEPEFEIIGQASNGVEAVAQARRLRPDVIVMDVCMPWMDGIDAAREILAAEPEVRIVSLSICDDPGTIQKMRRSGVFAHVMKSSPINNLVDTIRQAAELVA